MDDHTGGTSAPPVGWRPAPWRDRLTRAARRWWWLGAVAAVALGVRLGYWAVFLRHYVPTSDAAQYDRIARNLAAGHGFSDVYPSGVLHRTAFRPPLYPGLLGALYRVFGAHLAVAQAANAVLGSLVVATGAWLVHRVAGRRTAVAAAAVLAVFPPLVANDVVPLSEPLSLLLMLVLAGLLAERRWDGAAAVTGLLVLGRNSAQGVIVVVALWVILTAGGRTALRFATIAAVIVAPWVVRNQLQVHAPVVVTSDGFNLAAIYSPEAKQSYPELQFVDPTLDVRFASHWSLLADEARWDSYLRHRGLQGLAEDPRRVLTVVANNLERMAEVRPGGNVPAELSDGRVLRVRNDTLPAFYVVAALGAAGLWKHRRSRHVQAVAGLAVYFVVLTALFVPAPRLRAPADLACCLGVGLLAAPARRRTDGALAREEVRGTTIAVSGLPAPGDEARQPALTEAR